MSKFSVVSLAAILLSACGPQAVRFTPGAPAQPSLNAPLLPEATSQPTYVSATVAPTSTPSPPPTETLAPTVSDEPLGTIIFTCFVGGIDQICSIEPDGSNERQLTIMSATAIYASPSPNGHTIVFVSRQTGMFEIYRMNRDGTELTQLTDGLGDLFAPEISPDQSSIVFTRLTPDEGTRVNQNIWIMGFDGDAPFPLTDVRGNNVDPTWSPDGSQIAFASDRTGATELYIMNADGSDVRQITSGLKIGGRSDWSPDGRWLAFYAGQRSALQLYQAQIATRSIEQLTFDGDNKAPSFSPDGQWIVFTGRDAGGDNELFIMRIDGTDIRQVTFNERPDWQPRWGP